ncbi:MAG: LysR substrate-binding domain-containing protein [Cellvibrionaceae bacterium]
MLLYNHMAIFAQIALHGSFSKAAERLKLPKSTVSLKLRELEEHLGVKLLHRTTRQLTLTEQGRQLLPRCQQMLETAEDAAQLIHGLQQEPQGSLRISCPFAMSESFLSELIIDYSRRYPKVKLQLISANNRVDLIKEGFDLAFRFGALEDSTLIARKIISSPRRLLASASYLEEHGEPLAPSDLRSHRCLVSEYTAQWTFMKGSREHRISPQPFVQVTDVSFAKKLALEGVGICMLPDLFSQDAVADGSLKPLLPDYNMQPVDLNLILPSRGLQSASVKCFVEALFAGVDR